MHELVDLSVAVQCLPACKDKRISNSDAKLMWLRQALTISDPHNYKPHRTEIIDHSCDMLYVCVGLLLPIPFTFHAI